MFKCKSYLKYYIFVDLHQLTIYADLVSEIPGTVTVEEIREKVKNLTFTTNRFPEISHAPEYDISVVSAKGICPRRSEVTLSQNSPICNMSHMTESMSFQKKIWKYEFLRIRFLTRTNGCFITSYYTLYIIVMGTISGGGRFYFKSKFGKQL